MQFRGTKPERRTPFLDHWGVAFAESVPSEARRAIDFAKGLAKLGAEVGPRVPGRRLSGPRLRTS